MLPVTKSLCPVDFSDFSHQALDKAGELAAHFGAELWVLHVMQTLETAYSIAPYEEMLSFDVTAYEKAIREGAKEQLQSVVERQQTRSSRCGPCCVKATLPAKSCFMWGFALGKRRRWTEL